MPSVSQPWVDLFEASVLFMALCGLYGCWRFGKAAGVKGVLREFGVLALFAAAFYVLESFALYQTPFYAYSDAFRFAVTPVDFGWMKEPPLGGCIDQRGVVPLAIPLMEASLCYVVMHAGLLMRVGPVLLPMAASVVFVTLDGFLDAVASTSARCGADGLTNHGIGLWHWVLPEGVVADWFGVPVFNFAAWFASPVILIAAAQLLGIRNHDVQRSWREWLLMAAAVVFVVFFSPEILRLPNWIEHALFLACVLIVFHRVLLAYPAMNFDNRIHLHLLLAQMALLTFSVAAFLYYGLLHEDPLLLLVAFGVTVVSCGFCWAPYRKLTRAFENLMKDIDRFIRLHYVGFPCMLVLIGAHSVNDELGFQTALLLLAVALLYNVFSYVSNDIIDLPVDRTQEKRRLDPLVRGAIGTRTAWAIAGATVPLSLALTGLGGGPLAAYGYLALAFAGMTVYNVYGKKVRYPLLTDFIEAVAWGSLALYGAAMVPGAAKLTTWLIFAYGAAFIFLINGIHGGLRDLVNDKAHGKRNTALLLGGWHDEHGQVFSARPVQVFSFGVHFFMVALALAMVVVRIDHYHPTALKLLWVLFVAVELWSTWLIWQITRTRNPDRDPYISLSLLALLVIPVIVFGLRWEPGLALLLAGTYFVPFLGMDPTLRSLRTLIVERRVPKIHYPSASDG